MKTTSAADAARLELQLAELRLGIDLSSEIAATL